MSNLPFSPALVGQLGFYARRLRKEETTRRLGLFVTILALIVQSFAIIAPPSSANASNASDLIPGGVSSKSGIIAYYDNPNTDYKKMLDYIGITRAELAAAQVRSMNSQDYGKGDWAWLSWGRTSRMSAAQGEIQHTVDGSTVIYSRPLWRYDTSSWTSVHGSQYTALVGTSAARGEFAILFGCGNPVTRTLPPQRVKITVCRPGVGVISIYNTEKQASDLPPDSDACKPKVPAAVCKKIGTPVKIDRTHFNFSANADTENGATISGYVFTIRKGSKDGPVVVTKTISTTAKTAETGSIELKEPTTYYVSVVVKTSLGDKPSTNCETTVTVVPPEKCEVNPTLTKEDADCKPCPGNHDLWYKSPECHEVTVESKSATNLTQGGDATKVTARASDRVEYKLTVKNPGKVPAKAYFVEELDDVLEYASIQDNGGGTFDAAKKTLSWPVVTLAAGETQTRTFVVALPATIPTTARGSSEPSSYDCIMSNTFGNNVAIRVQCDTPKIVEQTVRELPATGPGENVAFAGILLVVVTFFWARSRQLGKEVRLVRKDFSAGTI